jgi:hypothetical protein
MIYKFKFLALGILASALVACSEYEEDAFSFDDSLPQYVDFASGSASSSIDTTLINGEVVAIGSDTISISEVNESVVLSTRIRVARTVDTNVDVNVTGDIEASETLTIPAGELSTSLTVAVPFSEILNGSATATITSVDGGLTIGRTVPDGATPVDNIVVTINWEAE